jgi:hypothetical protein
MFTAAGERGWIGSWHKHTSDDSLVPVEEVLEECLIDETRIFICTSFPADITKRWTMKLRGQLKPREHDCTFEFGLIVAGRAKVNLFYRCLDDTSHHVMISFTLMEISSLITGLVKVAGKTSSASLLLKRRVNMA